MYWGSDASIHDEQVLHMPLLRMASLSNKCNRCLYKTRKQYSGMVGMNCVSVSD